MRRVNKIEVLKRKQQQRVLLLFLGLFFALPFNNIFSQVKGWEQIYGDGGIGLDEGHTIIHTADEGFALLGTDHPQNKISLIKTDPNGYVIWSNLYDGGLISYSGADMVQDTDGSYVVAGTCNSACAVNGGGGSDIVILRIDQNGNKIDQNEFGLGTNDDVNSIIKTQDGGFMLVGFSTVSSSDNKQIYFAKIDESLDITYQVVFGDERDEEGFDVIETDSGNFVAVGKVEDGGDKIAYALSISATGDSLWRQFYGTGDDFSEATSIAFDKDENGNNIGLTMLTTRKNFSTGIDIKIIETTFFGEELNTKSFLLPLKQDGFSITNTEDGGYIIAGAFEQNAFRVDALLMRLNSSLEEEWSKTFGSPVEDSALPFAEAYNVIQTHDGGFAFAGIWSEGFGTDINQIYLVKTNSEGEIFSNIIKGKVFKKADGIGIKDWIVEAAKDGEDVSYFGTTDADGFYHILVDPGAYNVAVQLPNTYWSPEIGSYDITFLNPADTTELDFELEQALPCTDLEVDISSPYLVPGNQGYYAVRYCNHGTATAENAFVDIQLDEGIFFLSSSNTTFTFIDSIYRFELGDVAFGQCDSFLINIFIDNSAFSSQTHCTKAHIYPDIICDDATGWNEASVRVKGDCDGDNVNFEIINEGAGDMGLDKLNFVIIEDVVMRTDPGGEEFSLASGESMNVTYEANGSTFRIISQQAEGHPGDSRPTVAIEGCGGFTPGMVTQFPEDDYNHFIAKDCQENFDSAPSNLKTGHPKGYGDSLKVASNTDLNYHLKFQNVGIDTAIRVVIRDTLSPQLDPSTIRIGASSHDYIYEVYGDGILKFTFEDITLPGSSTNEAASHIFVKYRISQKPGNEVGTLIKNSAAITFDYNAPLGIGNQTCHLVGGLNWEDFVIVNTENIFHPGVSDIKVYPNPFSEMATFEMITSEQLHNLTFSVFDMAGRVLYQENFSGNQYQFYRGNLTAGFYVYKIESAGQLVSTGKMMVR